jgi:hypothetical protein
MLVFKAIPLSGFQCPNSLAAQESNGCELPDCNSERALFAARCFSSASTPWDGFGQILTNLTNKFFSGFFAGEVVGVFRDQVHPTTEKFFCPAKGPLGRDIFF